jgi:hypothetical protein
MKNRKKEIEWNIDTKKMKRRDQVVISRLRTAYTMATHGYIINEQDNNKCFFCNIRLTVDHTLWTAKKQRQRDKEPTSKITSGTKLKTECNNLYRISKKNWFLPRNIDNMKEQNNSFLG